MNIDISCRIPLNIAVLFSLINNVELSICSDLYLLLLDKFLRYVSCRIPLNIAVLFYLINNVELSIFHCTFRILKHNEKVLFDFDWALFWQIEPWPHLNDLFKAIKIPLTCSQHRNLQNIVFEFSKSFVRIFFAWSKVGRISPESRNLF